MAIRHDRRVDAGIPQDRGIALHRMFGAEQEAAAASGKTGKYGAEARRCVREEDGDGPTRRDLSSDAPCRPPYPVP
jgi:hypothetical protein